MKKDKDSYDILYMCFYDTIHAFESFIVDLQIYVWILWLFTSSWPRFKSFDKWNECHKMFETPFLVWFPVHFAYFFCLLVKCELIFMKHFIAWRINHWWWITRINHWIALEMRIYNSYTPFTRFSLRKIISINCHTSYDTIRSDDSNGWKKVKSKMKFPCFA